MTAPSADVTAIPAVWSGEVLAEHIDENGHMNLLHYVELNARAIGLLMDRVGLDAGHRQRADVGLFTLEQRVTYRSEMLVGRRMSVRPAALDRSDSVVHTVSYLVDEDSGAISSTLEQTVMSVSRATRRAVPFPPWAAARLDEAIATTGATAARPDPACGRIGIRRRG
ncbi:thioesterase family protein [Pseudonocardia pini]|uniref:thioesterase family protein n=1 Tax=Pseudonocardia pini TaxID=2758030 RepID=UPI0015F00A0D|nr:thioesterase family protein [Pseudonocardia pini]